MHSTQGPGYPEFIWNLFSECNPFRPEFAHSATHYQKANRTFSAFFFCIGIAWVCSAVSYSWNSIAVQFVKNIILPDLVENIQTLYRTLFENSESSV